METLHLIRSLPDERARALLAGLSAGAACRTIALFDPNLDYDELVRAIFAASRVISWW